MYPLKTLSASLSVRPKRQCSSRRNGDKYTEACLYR